MAKDGIVVLHGKEYKTVGLRLTEFRRDYPDHRLTSEIYLMDAEYVVIKASIWKDGVVVATGHACEFKQSSQINRTSYVENCETSAWGRALANFGLGGMEIASAEEIANAIHQQNQGNVKSIKPPVESSKSIARDVFDKTDEDTQIKLTGIADDVKALMGKPTEAYEFLESQELDADQKVALWSLLDSRERAALKKVGQERKAS